VERLREAQEVAEQELRIALLRPEAVKPQIDDESPVPLFASGFDFVHASQLLINHKRLNGGAP
jgi:hypothetical protein